MKSNKSTRRRFVAMTGGMAMSFLLPRFAQAENIVRAYRNPGCGCCEKWADLMTSAGFSITMEDDDNLAARKIALGVSEKFAGCHTALIDNYVFEGHVPPADIVQFLSEKPDALGLSVPGMPVGSPGMEAGDQKDAYDVLLMKKDGSSSVYKSYS